MPKKFEIKPSEKPKETEPFDSTQDKPQKSPEVETWEGEGGTVETPEQTPAEVPETVVEEDDIKSRHRKAG